MVGFLPPKSIKISKYSDLFFSDVGQLEFLPLMHMAIFPIFKPLKIKNYFAVKEIFWFTRITYPMGIYWDRIKAQLLEHIYNYIAQYLFNVEKFIQARNSI